MIATPAAIANDLDDPRDIDSPGELEFKAAEKLAKERFRASRLAAIQLDTEVEDAKINALLIQRDLENAKIESKRAELSEYRRTAYTGLTSANSELEWEIPFSSARLPSDTQDPNDSDSRQFTASGFKTSSQPGWVIGSPNSYGLAATFGGGRESPLEVPFSPECKAVAEKAGATSEDSQLVKFEDLDLRAVGSFKEIEKALTAHRLTTTEPRESLKHLKDVQDWMMLGGLGRPYLFLGEVCLSGLTRPRN